ncbi:signal peptide peptidase SppA [Alkalibacillus haloalkaliphilus]|uniref:Putative signal peptide peptidase SppA n=1 Tax=Alkalibacillus haloalkaliphilus TaxID=94136 RepID=A0A511W793_9BACI|nr:signal peptide peptidase SppA [Alkalibacillus haloalkaliphilus]MDV2582612.1 signal peptide peptidase SppA [Alkalibacillus haloalkaliphilus]GEN46960.1 putative signal peptide peptidase SppA [Alkalibacillus haloalkaliphilus]
MDKKRWIALGIAVGLFIVSIIAQVSTTVATTNWNEMFESDRDFSEEVREDGDPFDKVAVIHLEGVIQSSDVGGLLNTSTYNHKMLLDMLDFAKEDDDVEAVVLRVNTPGGGVVESEEVHSKILDLQEEDKPVYVSMGNMAASGGYYVSAPADHIVAHPATLTGSIGVIMEAINFAELADDLGVEFNTITSGEYKDIMSSFRPMTDDEESILQSMIDEMYDEFVQVIANGRDMDESTVRDLGDGRIYTGSQAEENGLVDSLGSLDDAISQLKEDHNLQNAQVVEYEYQLGFNAFLGGTAQRLVSDEFRFSQLEEMIRKSSAPRAMYLYTE